jgi:hypothetical protein
MHGCTLRDDADENTELGKRWLKEMRATDKLLHAQ